MFTRSFQCFCRTSQYYCKTRTYSNLTSAIIFKQARLANSGLWVKPFISRNFSAGGMEDLALPKVSSPEVCENVGVGEMESSEHDDAGEGDSYTGSVVSMTTPQKAASPVALFGEDQDALEKYSYFARGYTTEIYKIELQNLPIRIGYQKLKKYLCSLDLKPAKIRQPHNVKRTAFINFRCEEDRVMAIEVLNGRVWKSRPLAAKIAAPALDPLYKRKRPSDQDVSKMKTKRAKQDTVSLEQRLCEAVTPWAGVAYEKQLLMKEKDMRKALKQMASKIKHRNSNPGEWFFEHMKKHDQMICGLEPIRSSPMQKHYRNKCEFSLRVRNEGAEEFEGVGALTEGEKIEKAVLEETGTLVEEAKIEKEVLEGAGVVVGFRLGSYEEGDFDVASADGCCHIPERMKELAKLFQSFFSQSKLVPHCSRTEDGYWRMLTLRCHDSGETMATVQLHPQDLTPELIALEKSKLVEFFTSGEGCKAPPTSLYFQVQGRMESNSEPHYEFLMGEKYIYEVLLGMKFRISPAAFFQVNTSACEVLYKVIREAAAMNVVKHPVIYDICCGTGTIGLYLSQALSARKVVGVEAIPQAVMDAKENAWNNGITNAEFVCGKAEDVMGNIRLPLASRGDVIGVVDPPRGGVHSRVIKAIRKCSSIQRLIYVSCKPNGGGVLNNIADLCGRKSNRVKGDPFRPVSAIPIDMFPQTPHCELVIVLEREPMEEGKDKDDDEEEEEEDKDDDEEEEEDKDDDRPTDKAHICGTD